MIDSNVQKRDKTKAIATLVAIGISLVSFSALASAPHPLSRKSRTPGRPANRPMVLSATSGVNGSYLVGTSVRKQQTLNDHLFDADSSRAMRREYEVDQSAYEAREKAGLVEHSEEKTRFSTMRGLAMRAIEGVYRFRAKIVGRDIRRNVQNSNVPREPIAAAVLAASLYTGRSMNFKLIEGVRVHSRVDLKDRAASLTVPLSQMGLTSTVAYNRDTNVSAQLSQRVTSDVSAVVDSADRGTARLVYSVSF